MLINKYNLNQMLIYIAIFRIDWKHNKNHIKNQTSDPFPINILFKKLTI